MQEVWRLSGSNSGGEDQLTRIRDSPAKSFSRCVRLTLQSQTFLCARFLRNELRAFFRLYMRSIFIRIYLRKLGAEKDYLRRIVYPDQNQNQRTRRAIH